MANSSGTDHSMEYDVIKVVQIVEMLVNRNGNCIPELLAEIRKEVNALCEKNGWPMPHWVCPRCKHDPLESHTCWPDGPPPIEHWGKK